MSKKKNSDVNDYISTAYENLCKDRVVAENMIEEIIMHSKDSKEKYVEFGLLLSQYTQNIQRSNEQLIKLISIMVKSGEDAGLSSEDMDAIYEAMEKNK